MWKWYHRGVAAYAFATRLAAGFSAKARLRAEGAANTLTVLPTTPTGRTCLWMHCASVGEFEQGRPIWEALRRRSPDARFVLTFFSPSGAELFRDRPDLGEVYYLPWDVQGAAAAFVERLFPGNSQDLVRARTQHLALFVKYEWWLGFHRALQVRSVAAVLISGAFRQNQAFFRTGHPGHALYREALQGMRLVSVQTEASRALLDAHKYETPCIVAGDTRLDRVLEIRDTPFENRILEVWAKRQPCILVAGSTWPIDEGLLATCLAAHPSLSIIVAPHELGAKVRAHTGRTFVDYDPIYYTDLRDQVGQHDEGRPPSTSRVLVLDTIGLLSRVYRFGTLAYVGGGFGAGIHNTLEPAVYGIPVAFGPRHRRFVEAVQLRELGVGFAVADAEDLSNFVARFIEDPTARAQVLAKAEAYVATHRGATDRILHALEVAQLL